MSSYSYTSPLTDEIKSQIIQWMKQKHLEMTHEEAEDLFIEYIIIMIGNGKSMEEISKELKELMGDDVKAR